MNDTREIRRRELHEAAIEYYDRGLCPVPGSRDKRPDLRTWKQYQHRRPKRSTVHGWFQKGRFGLGLITGAVSGNLAVVDFDEGTAYEIWKARNVTLAATLPTVQTNRGFHVWCRLSDSDLDGLEGSYHKYAWGEFRFSGAFVMAPPSPHPAGGFYRFVVPFDDLPTVGYPELGVRTLDTDMADSADITDMAGHGRTPQDVSKSVASRRREDDGLLSLPPEVQEAVRNAVPNGPGQRHAKLFQLARRLRAVDGHEEHLAEAFNVWHVLAEPHIRTKNADVNFADFMEGYGEVRTPWGEGGISKMLTQIDQQSPPSWARKLPAGTQRLATLVRELQRDAHDDPFFLSARDAAAAMGVESPTTGSTMLKVFRQRGVLELVEEADRTRRKAASYRYLKPLDD